MNNKYNTKQKELILEYLKNNKEKHITANNIIKHFKEKNISVGKTTVYRQLEGLLDEKKVRRYILEGGVGNCYQYADNEECAEHYHLKCKECGQVCHLDCEIFTQIGSHLYETHKFLLDLSRTILYGKCEMCSKIN